MRIQDLKGKKVAVWGLGREGWSALKAIRKKLPLLSITVLNDVPLPPEDHLLLSGHASTDILIGAEALAALETFDVIIKSPGISSYRSEIVSAKARGVRFISGTSLWFAEHPEAKTVCVTGSKGKSTTASLIAHLLKACSLNVALCGNIGVPLLDLLDVSPSPDVWVIELSSYQTSDFEGSPSVSVLLNLFPEHLDWHGDVGSYYRDKLNLFPSMDNNGISVLNRLDAVTASCNVVWRNPVYFNDPASFHIADDYIWEGDTRLLPTSAVSLAGHHNLSNICAALTAVRALGIDPAACISALTTFQALPHRLAVLGENAGITYVDDSISTTPQSAIAALQVFSGRPVTILLGGFDRGLAWDDLAQFLVNNSVYAVVTLPNTGIKIATSIRQVQRALNCQSPLLYEADSLSQAVDIARSITPKGGVILLSPASPSYGTFKNFEARGLAFGKAAGFI